EGVPVRGRGGSRGARIGRAAARGQQQAAGAEEDQGGTHPGTPRMAVPGFYAAGARVARRRRRSQSRGARAPLYGTGVAPVTAPVRAVSCTYRSTSRSKRSGPSTTASGPITILGRRLICTGNQF